MQRSLTWGARHLMRFVPPSHAQQGTHCAEARAAFRCYISIKAHIV